MYVLYVGHRCSSSGIILVDACTHGCNSISKGRWINERVVSHSSSVPLSRILHMSHVSLQRKSIGCSAELAKGTPLGSSHSKFKDHFHSKDSATSLLRNSGPGEVTSALTRRNKSTSGLTGRNKRSTGGERLLGTHNGGRECSSEGRRKHSSERLDGRPGLPTPPRGGVPLTHSDTTVQ